MRKKIGGLIFKIRKSNNKKTNHVYFKRKSKIKNHSSRLRILKLRKLLLLILLFLFSITIIISLLFFSYRFIQNLRGTDKKNISENVYGLSNVPVFPNAEFIFKDNLDDQTVKNFLSLGYAVYRLPRDTNIEKVFNYYSDVLPTLGWTHVLSVPISSEEKRYGEYWVKDRFGLRIYTRLNDIWYQQLTLAQAQNGLEDEVKKDVARQLLLLTSEKSTLLPDYPWKLAFPSEYLTKYYATSIKSFQGVVFQRIGSDKKVIIEPVGYFGSTSYEAMIEKFVVNYNTKNKSSWRVVNSSKQIQNNEDINKSIITNGKEAGTITAIKNTQNTLIYVFVTFEDNDPFYNYILSKIESVTPL